MSVLVGKTALVTGAGRGIGRAIALRLGADGARVAVHFGTSAEAAQQTVDQIIRAGGEAFAVRAKLGVSGDADALWDAFDAKADGVDIIVNNAGILGDPGPFVEITESALDELFAVNVKAPLRILQRGMLRLRDGGRIVNVSSSLTHGSRAEHLLAYTMSKAAIDALTASLALSVGARGITVNAVGPGPVDTDMNASWLRSADGRSAAASQSPLGRVAGPEDIADVVAFLASEQSRWITGQWIDVSGGASL
ncbi:SDR family NAD(P)-dependent oxidoreductase [Lysinibacter cavernae]|uniref:NAD(P)-dependent dehydrogenase (Short-subunit alcohol dehydrogenase family) n=1 Tax=Lysinibacter cavernae TaxID=1640652 RepID=A0A7X5QYX0_9MICO|nr:SDR family oxidoreductase [Lysinibacter cavernae]NIH52496.1 NAD(P)-dependent dehydrogenase (short-subunit alcohol dehydrogenase family) [Lysinibacter cavernae]